MKSRGMPGYQLQRCVDGDEIDLIGNRTRQMLPSLTTTDILRGKSKLKFTAITFEMEINLVAKSLGAVGREDKKFELFFFVQFGVIP